MRLGRNLEAIFGAVNSKHKIFKSIFINGASSGYSLPNEVNGTNCNKNIEVAGKFGGNKYYIKISSL